MKVNCLNQMVTQQFFFGNITQNKQSNSNSTDRSLCYTYISFHFISTTGFDFLKKKFWLDQYSETHQSTQTEQAAMPSRSRLVGRLRQCRLGKKQTGTRSQQNQSSRLLHLQIPESALSCETSDTDTHQTLWEGAGSGQAVQQVSTLKPPQLISNAPLEVTTDKGRVRLHPILS